MEPETGYHLSLRWSLYGRILWTGPRAMKGTIWSPNYAVPIQEEEKEQEVEEQTNVEAFN